MLYFGQLLVVSLQLSAYAIRTQEIQYSELDGISEESVKQHISLYEGYVKNFNAIAAKLVEYAKEGAEKNALALGELIRRKSFEFDGMRLHELYFTQFEGGRDRAHRRRHACEGV